MEFSSTIVKKVGLAGAGSHQGAVHSTSNPLREISVRKLSAPSGFFQPPNRKTDPQKRFEAAFLAF
jgi:hypothetical protein